MIFLNASEEVEKYIITLVFVHTYICKFCSPTRAGIVTKGISREQFEPEPGPPKLYETHKLSPLWRVKS